MKTQDQVIAGIHAVNAMEKQRDLRNCANYNVKIVNGKTIICNH